MNVAEIQAVVERVVAETRDIHIATDFSARTQLKNNVGVQNDVEPIGGVSVQAVARRIGEELLRAHLLSPGRVTYANEQFYQSQNNYYYSSTLTSHGVTANFAVEIKSANGGFSISLPQFIVPNESVEQAVQDLQALELDFPQSKVAPELPVIAVAKNKNAETFSNLATAKERQDFLDKLSVDDLYQLALVSLHCTVIVLNYPEKKFKLFSFEQQTEIKRNLYHNLLPEVTGEYIESVGHLSATDERGLTLFADSLVPVLIRNPHEMQRLNADALFLLTATNPVFFTFLDTTALFRTKNEANSLTEDMASRYDALLDSHLASEQDNREVRNSIGNFAEYVANSVNKNNISLATALTSTVIQRSTITVGSANIKLTARLAADALNRKSGVKELVDLLENKPNLLRASLQNSDNVMLSSYLLDRQNLVKKLSPKAIKTLLQYDQGFATKIPTFLDGLAIRFGYGANPIAALSVEALFDVAVAAKNQKNQAQVNSIISRSITEPSRWQRFKLAVSGQPNYFKELLDSPNALSQFFKLASQEQVQQFVGRDETKRNILLAAIFHAQSQSQSKDIAYLNELKIDKINLLSDLQNQDQNLAVDDPLKRMLDARAALEFTQDATLSAELEAPKLIAELEEDSTKHEKMHDLSQWVRLLNLINSKPLMIHRLIEVIRAKPEIADMFIQNIIGVLNAIDMSSTVGNEKIYSLLTEIIQVIIKDHPNLSPNLVNYLLARISVQDETLRDKFQDQISRILEDQEHFIITDTLLNFSYANAHRADDTKRLSNAEHFFETLRFLLNVEGNRDGFTGKYINDNQTNIGNLIAAVISQWLKVAAETVKTNSSALDNLKINQIPVIRFYGKLYDKKEKKQEKELLDTIIEQNIGSCISLYDYDTKRQITWLYDQPSFWIGLFANTARFENYMNTHDFKDNDVMRHAFVAALPKLFAKPLTDDQENKTVQMIQAIINVNKTNHALISNLINEIRSLDTAERVEGLLKKIFANPNVLSILVHDKELGTDLSKSSSLWKALPDSKLLLEEFIRGQLSHIEVTAENSVDFEDMINAISDKKLRELVRTNAERLKLEDEDGEWVFAGTQVTGVVSDVSSSQSTVSAAMQTGHREDEGGEGEGSKKDYKKLQH